MSDITPTSPKDVYSSLPLLKSTSIRLLRIHPQAEVDNIHCSLESVELSDKPQYVALSYTWGAPTPQAALEGMSDERRFPIICNEQELRVTENLFCFLRHTVRKEIAIRGRWWIDAICINQNDNNERNAQILLMEAIYSKAALVLIWLGEEDEFTKSALELIEVLGTMQQSELQRVDPFKEMDLRDQYGKAGGSIMNDVNWTALWNFVQRSWFTRIWVLQEIARGKGFLFTCGDTILSHTKLINILRYATWTRYPLSSKDLIKKNNKALTALNFLQDGHDGPPICEPTEAVIVTRDFKASDPRDKVFALLSFFYEKHKILVDYNKTVIDIYIDFTKTQLETSKDLRVLSLTEGRENKTWKGLPSWVPDYSVNPGPSVGVFKGTIFTPSLHLEPEWDIDSSKRILALHGMQIDEITCVAESKGEWAGCWQNPRWVSILTDMGNTYVTGVNKIEAFWRTMIEDSTVDRDDYPANQSQYWKHPAPRSIAQSFRHFLAAHLGLAVKDARESETREEDLIGIFRTLRTL